MAFQTLQVGEVCRFLSALNANDLGNILKNIVTKDQMRRLLSEWSPDDIFDVLPTTITAKDYSGRLSDDDFFRMLPLGYSFRPTDAELMEYLRKKINGEDLPRSRIHEINLMDFGPEELSVMYAPVRENEWLFFSPRQKKYKGGLRPDRAAGNGYWKATGCDRDIGHDGCRKALVYYKGKPNPKPNKVAKTNWIMQEYRFKTDSIPTSSSHEDSPSMLLDEWVLCKIYQSLAYSSRKKSQAASEDNGDVQHEVDNYNGIPAVVDQPEPPIPVFDSNTGSSYSPFPVFPESVQFGDGHDFRMVAPEITPLNHCPNHDIKMPVAGIPSPWASSDIDPLHSSHLLREVDTLGLHSMSTNHSNQIQNVVYDNMGIPEQSFCLEQGILDPSWQQHYSSGFDENWAWMDPYQGRKFDVNPNYHSPTYVQAAAAPSYGQFSFAGEDGSGYFYPDTKRSLQ